MLIVPGACGHLLSDRLTGMMIWSAVVATVASVVGYVLASAAVFDTSVSGMMAVVAGVQFLLAVLFAPRHGLAARALRNLRLALQIASEDILATLYRKEEGATAPVSRPATWWTRLAARSLRRAGHVELLGDGSLALTDAGRQRAQSLVRAHRLWEAYLDTHFDLPRDHLHEPAERMEHFLGPALQEQLAAELPETARDPHGREIPPPAKDPPASP
jgi:hypothetical protein